ncbi:MerR family regulatory protein [Klenkia marina]|uniref:MerR family regulatory protein n=1 Tax=Klenkia marina TaxID=1960309 RepID=A0A1G4YM83_9ACTN|nr:MerR family transcriptional regulator [Klenkia marina]SCX54580.1 MerR family regulatory protein [Klenkia marina]
MTAAARPEGHLPDAGRAAADGRPRFTIGEVLAGLRDEFPDVTISKIRYLEGEDLVHPQRTPSGYRKFSTADIDRLRFVLTAQRDQYLPLRVIKEQLDALDRGEALLGASAPAATSAPAAPPVPAAVEPTAPAESAGPAEPMSEAAFAAAAGLEPGQLADCVQYGLITPGADGRYPASALPVAQAAGGLARHGIEPRHLRVHRTSAEREAALVEQVVAPVLLARSEDARARAAEQLQELGALSTQLHTALLEARLREVLGPDADA